ncbi:hypothetical protein AMECASPLE_030949 [Ameca splendens]|uniref:Uncharacterized protein n=1 Tax=Ameca splendens TaxID=208324 RepID=A0ABV0YTF5_9TELE
MPPFHPLVEGWLMACTCISSLKTTNGFLQSVLHPPIHPPIHSHSDSGKLQCSRSCPGPIGSTRPSDRHQQARQVKNPRTRLRRMDRGFEPATGYRTNP